MKLDNLTSKDFHDELVASTRRRNARTHDIQDPAEFDQFMEVIDKLGQAALIAEKEKYPPLLVGRAMQYYSRCIAVAYAAKSTIVPEAAP